MPKCEAKVTLQSRATDSESYLNLVSSLETQLGELGGGGDIYNLHRSPATGVKSLHSVRSKPSSNNMTHSKAKC